MKLRIRITREPDADLELEFAAFPVTVGRSSECDVVLDDRQASRRHLEIDWRGGHLIVTDLGSSNGTLLDGEPLVESRQARPESELRVGKHRLHLEFAVPDVEDEKPADRAGAVQKRIRRRRLLSGATIIAMLGLLAWLAWGIYRSGRDAFERPDGPQVAIPEEAQRELDGLIERMGEAQRVDVAFIRSAGELATRFADLDVAGTNPFRDIYEALKYRHDFEVKMRLHELSSLRLELQREKRYGELFLAFETAATVFRKEAPVPRSTFEQIQRQATETVETAFNSIERELAALRSADLRDDYLGLAGWGQHAFAGTTYANRLETLAEKARAEFERLETEARRRHADALARLEKLERQRAEEQAARKEKIVIGLSALLEGPIGAGLLRERKIDLGGRKVHPLRVHEDGRLEFETEGVSDFVSFLDIEPAVQLRMALACLEGEALFEAARYGYRRETGELPDQVLYAYLTEKGSPRAERQANIDSLLAEVRQLDSVPEGGFEYSKDHGWEDVRAVRRREILSQAAKHTAEVVGALTVRKMEKAFETLAELLREEGENGQEGQEGIDAGLRSAIRKNAGEALQELKSKLVQDVVRRAGSRNIARLRQAKSELNERRREALTIIRDRKIYLPENHPRYREGDKVNGQAAVDAAVDAIRELWDAAGTYTIQLDMRARRLIARMRLIDEKYHPELQYRPSAADDEEFLKLWSAVGQSVSIRTFALDRTEAGVHEYNRKVEQYNSDFAHEDLTDAEKQHVIVVNEYREMLGLRRCFIDIRICRATRKHSAACDRAGRIWHNGPDGTPQSRAREEGFPTGVAENVAMGYANPADIWWRGWYRASDHHRNAVGTGWTCIGYGYSGRVGTQNFAVLGPPFR